MMHTTFPQSASTVRLTVMQGQARVSDSGRVELTTVLGSCVACCLFDPQVAVGGMNHFLLAEPMRSHSSQRIDENYGVYLMEVLINEMLAYGATRSGMRAHLYGGANLRAGLPQIGAMNAAFAENFLAREGIALVRADMGGFGARRATFLPALGRARCRTVSDHMVAHQQPSQRPSEASGKVELF